MQTLISVVSFIVIAWLLFNANVMLFVIFSLLAIAYAVYAYIPTFWAVKAQNAFGEGDFKKAKRLYKKAINTKRAKLQIRINYAYVLMRTGDFDEAEEILDKIIRVKVLKKEEYRYTAKQQRCMVYYKQGRLDEALEDAYEMFNSGYRNTQLYGMLGYFKLISGEPLDEVTKFCEEAVEYNSDDRDILDNLSICYYKQRRYKEARELSEKILEDSPKFVEAYYHGAQIAIKCGDMERARELVSKIDDCNRSNMTTISLEEVAAIKKEVGIK